MTFEIIIVICVGLGAAGLVLAPTKLLGIRLPKVVLPLVIGGAMLGYTEWSRYSWEARSVAALEPGQVVVQTFDYEGALEPWTMVFPRVNRLMVLDGAATGSNPEHPGVHLVRLLLIEQYDETIALPQFIDCAKRRRAPVTGETGPSGLPAEGDWVDGGEPKRLFDAVCAGVGSASGPASG